MSVIRMALVTAEIRYSGQPLKDLNGKVIRQSLTCGTDIDSDAVGDVMKHAVRRAWLAGVDPVSDPVTVKVSFKIKDIPGEPNMIIRLAQFEGYWFMVLPDCRMRTPYVETKSRDAVVSYIKRAFPDATIILEEA